MKLRTLLVLGLILAVGGCSIAGIPNPFDRGGRGSGSLRIEITNLNFNDATLHVVSGGTRTRLGTVTGKSTAVHTLAWDTPRDLRMEVNLVGEGPFSTNRVDARPGQTLQLHIESDSRRTRLIHGTRGSGSP